MEFFVLSVHTHAGLGSTQWVSLVKWFGCHHFGLGVMFFNDTQSKLFFERAHALGPRWYVMESRAYALGLQEYAMGFLNCFLVWVS